MAVRVISQEVFKDTTEVTDGVAENVSLVRHGANRQAFRIVKEDKELSLVVQSLLVPKTVKIEDLVPSAPWIRDIRKDQVADRGQFTEYTHLRREAFKEESIRFQPVGADGAFVISGELHKEKADAVMLPTDAMDLPVAQIQPPPINVSFGDWFFKELDAFVGTIQGAMRQSGAESGTRRKSVTAAWKALGVALNQALDAIDNPGQGGAGIAKTAEKLDELRHLITTEDPDMDETKIKEMIKEALEAHKPSEDLEKIKADFQAEIEKLKAEHAAELEKLKGESEKGKADEPSELEEMKKKIDALTAAVVSGAQAGDEDTKTKADTPDERAEKMKELLNDPGQWAGGLDKETRQALGLFRGTFISHPKEV